MSGRLARTTAPLLAQALRLREAEGFTTLFVDVGTLVDERELDGEEVQGVFPPGRRLAFHLIDPTDGLRLQPGHDPRFVFHRGPASAWTVWMHGPSTKGRKNRTPVRPYA
ncbi:hypothetical protein OG883_10785 [Streptomyces sp. NBC_01142]|uniref:hypothetical protein n=1 Tax=Streptomyces sp. NBC_01142 TaxID=2975865 RepID=UPI00225B5301|nr:hypothetical protein [Streptomyces sp. NBC_01142]MCX4820386.1 hypothetical protein [Streptomyces sp. NBC_01142]